MVIGIDGNEANVEKLVGVSVYTVNLLTYFQKKADQNLSFRIYLKEPPKSHLPLETDFFQYEVMAVPFLWSRLFLPLKLYLRLSSGVW